MDSNRLDDWESPPRGRWKWLLLLFSAVIAATLAFTIFLKTEVKQFKYGGLEPGNPLPAIKVDGWLNGPGPTPESLKGKVVVIDAWASWCGPCLKKAPELVASYRTFHPKGAVFLGLSSEAEDEVVGRYFKTKAEFLAKLNGFIKQGKIPWPCGYGARETLDNLHVEFIPQLWVVGADGIIQWNSDAPGTLDEAIERALASAGR